MRVPGAGDSLAGRAETIPLLPLSQGEQRGAREDFVASIMNGECAGRLSWQTQTSRADVVHALCAGGLPGAARRDVRRRNSWLSDYVDRIVRRDAETLGRVSVDRLKHAVNLLAANQYGELVVAHLARHLRVSEPTVNSTIEILQALY